MDVVMLSGEMCSGSAWRHFSGTKCVYVSSEVVRQKQARANCVSMGAELFTIETQDDQKVLRAK